MFTAFTFAPSDLKFKVIINYEAILFADTVAISIQKTFQIKRVSIFIATYEYIAWAMGIGDEWFAMIARISKVKYVCIVTEAASPHH